MGFIRSWTGRNVPVDSRCRIHNEHGKVTCHGRKTTSLKTGKAKREVHRETRASRNTGCGFSAKTSKARSSWFAKWTTHLWKDAQGAATGFGQICSTGQQNRNVRIYSFQAGTIPRDVENRRTDRARETRSRSCHPLDGKCEAFVAGC